MAKRKKAATPLPEDMFGSYINNSGTEIILDMSEYSWQGVRLPDNWHWPNGTIVNLTLNPDSEKRYYTELVDFFGGRSKRDTPHRIIYSKGLI